MPPISNFLFPGGGGEILNLRHPCTINLDMFCYCFFLSWKMFLRRDESIYRWQINLSCTVKPVQICIITNKYLLVNMSIWKKMFTVLWAVLCKMRRLLLQKESINLALSDSFKWSDRLSCIPCKIKNIGQLCVFSSPFHISDRAVLICS